MILASLLLAVAAPAAPPRTTARPRPLAAVRTTPPSSDWLQGLWVADADKGEQMEGCASWQALFYQADGQYLKGEVTGRWALSGTRLERRQVAYAEGGGDEEQVMGEEVRTVERVSADRMREVGPGKQSTLYLRCPLPETPVAP